jgi:Helix-turn-helix domain
MNEFTLISPARAAAILNVTPGTLAVWRCEKRYQLPFVKVGRKVMYRMSDLERFIQSRTQPGIAERVADRRRRSRAA